MKQSPITDLEQRYIEMKADTGSLFQERVHSFSKQQAAEAFQQLRVALRQAEKRGDKDGVSWAYLNTAMIFRGQRQHASALHVLEKARTGFESMNNDLGMAATYEELSWLNRELNRNTLALDYSFKAARLLQMLNRPVELAWCYHNMSIVLFNLSRNHESLTYAKKASSLFSKYKVPACLAWNACNLGNLHFEMGLYSQAERYYKKAKEAFIKLRIKQGEAWSTLWLGMLARARSQYSKALELLEAAREEFEQLGLLDRAGWGLLNSAAILWMQGQADCAQSLNRKAIKFFGPVKNNDGVAWGLFQIARIQRDRGTLVKAWQTIRKALELYDHIANQKGYGWAQLEWGEIYMALGDLTHAHTCFLKAKEKADQFNLFPLKAEVEKNFAALYLDQGQLQKGIESLKTAESLSKKINAMDCLADVLMQKVRFALTMGNPSQARTYLSSVQGLIKEYKLNRFQLTADICRGEILVFEGKFSEAEKVFTSTVKKSSKSSCRYDKIEAMLGDIQLKTRNISPAHALSFLKTRDKEIRAMGARKLKAKYLFLKLLFEFRRKSMIDFGQATQVLRTLDEQGFALLKLQFLGVLEELCLKNGREGEATHFREEKSRLLQSSAYDLRLVHPRNNLFQNFPVPVVT